MGELPNDFANMGLPLGAITSGFGGSGVGQIAAPHDFQYAETAPDLNVSWAPVPHVLTFIDLTEAIPGPALRDVGARPSTLVWVAVNLSF